MGRARCREVDRSGLVRRAYFGGLLSDLRSNLQSAKAAPPPNKSSEAFLALLRIVAVSEATAGRTHRLNGK